VPRQPPRPPVPGAENVIELNADRQLYDERDQVYRAQGNASLRFRGALLRADRIQVNVPNRIVVAEGNAVLTRGQQVIQGERLEYNLVQGEGTVLNARGELDLAAANSDFSTALPTDDAAQRPATQTTGDRVTAAQPVQVTGANRGVTFGLTAGNNRNNTTTGTTGEVL
jgi:LptA/(LptD N-terminal domain) LPS transport protein